MNEDTIKFDFGFSAVSGEDLSNEVNNPTIEELEKKIKQFSKELDDEKFRARAVYNAIVPLLDNLRKDSDKEYIKWPNRVDSIDKFQSELEDILTDQSLDKYK